MQNKDLPYFVATSAIPGVGTSTFSYLIKHFKTAKNFWEAPKGEIEKLKINANVKESILTFRTQVDPNVYLQTVWERGIKVFTKNDRQYPTNLRSVSDAPPVLYVRGQLLERDDLAIAVVGARYATYYGRQVTESIVTNLATSGLTIVSGLARGIDSFAHQAALNAGARTIAVLGSGLDIIYPPENKKLADEIVKNGALVSEFPLGFPSVPSNFPARNRIISGLSLGVLVTEAAIDSGSLITAGQAAEQGRDVFAVPGPITSKMSEGTNKLIKEGVHPISTANEILEMLDIKRKTAAKEVKPTPKLNSAESKIINCLDGQAKHIDIIARETKIKIEKLSVTLTELELKGVIKNYGLGLWAK